MVAGRVVAMAGVGVSFGIAVVYWAVSLLPEQLGDVNLLPAAGGGVVAGRARCRQAGVGVSFGIAVAYWATACCRDKLGDVNLLSAAWSPSRYSP